MIHPFLYSLAVLSVSIPLMLAASRSKKISGGIFLFSLTAGSFLGLISAVGVLVSRVSVDYCWDVRMPMGELSVGIDPLSAFFLLTITVLFFGAGVYGYGYLKDSEGKDLSCHYAFYHLAFISLMLVVTAQNAVLFLIAWEMVTLSSYFLITFHDERESVREAGYLYLIATHTGTFCLGVMFILMGQQAGSMNFDQMALASFPSASAGILFILGVMGFGVKAGFIPLHIWLPHAHPAAPAHVSAVLSGVMIKMGIYGLMRIIFIIKDFPSWCAVALLVIGMVSGVGGVLYALGQHEIKKLLAYHSIENIGIITLGLGIGLWGQISHHELIALTGYAGALLHVFNHAIFKGLLFLSAGSLIRSTHTGEIDQLGGLLKHLRWTGHLFLIGSLAICGLPLLNGFISEWLVFVRGGAAPGRERACRERLGHPFLSPDWRLGRGVFREGLRRDLPREQPLHRYDAREGKFRADVCPHGRVGRDLPVDRDFPGDNGVLRFRRRVNDFLLSNLSDDGGSRYFPSCDGGFDIHYFDDDHGRLDFVEKDCGAVPAG